MSRHVTKERTTQTRRLERTNQFSFRLILHMFSVWSGHVMNKRPEDSIDELINSLSGSDCICLAYSWKITFILIGTKLIPYRREGAVMTKKRPWDYTVSSMITTLFSTERDPSMTQPEVCLLLLRKQYSPSCGFKPIRLIQGAFTPDASDLHVKSMQRRE